MKNSNKKYIVLSLVFIAICLPLLILTLVLISRPSNTKTENTLAPQSFPVSYTGTKVDVDTSTENIQYKYALITKEDFLLLRNETKELYINLEMRSWRDISFSDNGQLVGVLGQTGKDIYDLFIYNTKTKKWIQATEYINSPSGIQDFIWISNNLIYYIQGESADRWLHSYNYSSGEIIKLIKVDGDFANSNENAENIVIDNINRFTIYDKNLNLLAEVSKQHAARDNAQVVFNKIYADFGEKFYLANDRLYYQYNPSASEDKISPKEFEHTHLCQINENSLITIEQNTENLVLYTSDISGVDNQKSEIARIPGEEAFEEIKCIDGEIYFYTESAVYNIKEGSYNLNITLSNSRDFDIL